MGSRLRRTLSSALIIFVEVIILCALVEAPFRIYDHWYRFPQVEDATHGNLGNADFASIISYLMKTGRVVRDPDLIWKHTPKSKTYEFNSLGLRGKKEYSKTHAPGVFRIIVFGGSQPFGLGVEIDQAYSAYLQEDLSRGCKSRQFEVINAAAPGHSTVQVLNLFRLYMIDYTPDLIIVDAGFNDQIRLSGDYSVQDKEAVKMSPLKIRLLSLAERSSFFWYLRGWVARVRGSLTTAPPTPHGSSEPLTRVSLEDTLRNYDEIKRLAATRGIATLFMSQIRLDREKVNLELLPMSHKTEPYVDIYTPLSQSTELLADFSDDVHTTPQGHEKIAGYLSAYLLGKGDVCPQG
jgi:lysophospholipase L1-like esterase